MRRLLCALLMLGLLTPIALATTGSDRSLRAEIVKERAKHEHYMSTTTSEILSLANTISIRVDLPWTHQVKPKPPRYSGEGSEPTPHRTVRQQLAFERKVRARDQRQAARLLVKLQNTVPPHFNDWVCIHKHEGAWNDNTGNGYYGGLQMDRGFMQAYAPELYRVKGTANNWGYLEQMWAAERAWRSRGFRPWPNTARACGLL